MGNTASSTEGLQAATAEVAQQNAEADAAAAAPEAAAGGIKLYRFLRAGSAGRWELQSSHARPSFYDAAGEGDNDKNTSSDWWIEVEGGDVDARADDRLQYVADRAARRVTFSANEALWALRFPTAAGLAAFMDALEDKVFYNAYGLDNDDAGRAKILGADYKDMFFSAFAPGDDAGAAPMEDEATAPPDLPSPGEGGRNVRTRETAAKEDGSPIQGLVMGATDNSYLLRGSVFDVMRNVEGGLEDAGVSFSLLTPNARRAGGAAPSPMTTRRGGAGATGSATPSALTPGKVIMAQHERRMNLLSPGDASAMFHADVEAGKVVSEWRFEKDAVEIPQIDIATDSKAAQLGDASTFLGLDANRLCRWDVRDPHGVVQTATAASPAAVAYQGGKDYARGTNFSCMATSGDGYVVVGSKDGKLRLYSSTTLAQAKTQIPGLGKPITSVDVTYDGRWVLATTDDYLMVLKTTFEDDAGREASSFTARGGGKLALPRLLRLKPEDVLLTGGKALKGGKFTWVTEAGRAERWVVASVGNYSVVWNFRRVKSSAATASSLGGLPTSMDYHLAQKDEEVVDSSFMHDRFTPVSGGQPRDSLVVATPHKVFSLASD